MKVLDWNKTTTYMPPDFDGSLMLAEWKAGECTVDPTATSTNTKEISTTAIVRALSIQDLLSSELLNTTPEEVAELFLLCQEDAAEAFANYRSKLNIELASEQASVAWVANAFFYFREDDEVQTGTVNLLTGELVLGMEFLLKKYPLTSQPQQPQVQSVYSLEQGLSTAVLHGLTSRSNDPATLQCLFVHKSTLTTHAPGKNDVQKQQYTIERTEIGSVALPSPHLASSAIIYTPLLIYSMSSAPQHLIYDPTNGRLYQGGVDISIK